MRTSHANRRVFLIGLVATAVAAFCSFLVLGTPSALAAYGQLGTFAGNPETLEEGGYGSGDGQLLNPGQADVNGSSGKLYVADTDNERVEVFRPTTSGGEYDSQAELAAAPTGLAIDQVTGDVYVATPSGVVKLEEGLAPVSPTQWTDPGVTGALAVDPSDGDLLVADQAGNLIRRYESDGTPAGSFAAERPVDVAANSTGEVFVVTSTGDITGECGPTSAVKRFSAAGVSLGTVGGSLEVPGAVAVDPDDDTIAVAANVGEYFCEYGPHPRVAFFAADGTAIETAELIGNTLYAMVPGLAIAGAGSSRVYAVTKSPHNDQWGNTQVVVLANMSPSTAEVEPASRVGRLSATLNGTVNPAGDPTSCRFEYSVDASFGSSAPCSVQPGAGTQPVQVRAELAGLQEATTYNFRLVASKGGGMVTRTSLEGSFTTATLETEEATAISAEGAVLNGTINPGGAPTAFWFEYGTDESYGSAIPVSHASAGEGTAPVSVSRAVNGLAAATTYHYRVVASNGTGTVRGLDRTFTTASEQAPPPQATGRAYELVSPADKGGGGVSPTTFGTKATADGERALFSSNAGFADAQSTISDNQYVSTRTSAGWTTRAIAPPFQPYTYEAQYPILTQASSDLTKFVYSTASDPKLTPATPENHTTVIYLRNMLASSGQQYELLTPSGPDEASIYGEKPNYYLTRALGASEDLSHVVFTSPWPLTSDAPLGNRNNVYEWDNGEVSLVSVLDDGTPAPDAYLGSIDPGHPIDPASPEAESYAYGVMSADGRRVFFNDAVNGHIYMREDGTSTTDVSASQRATVDPRGSFPAEFLAADPNGTSVLFQSEERLTNNATAKPNLYLYDVTSQHLTDLSVDGSGSSTRFIGLLGASRDNSVVFLFAEDTTARRAYLYKWQDGALEKIAPAGNAFDERCNWESAPRSCGFSARYSYVSPDGRYLAFRSAENLTGYDADGYLQVYRYDSRERDLACVTCSQLLSKATGESAMAGRPTEAKRGEGVYHGFSNTTLTADGTVFFQTEQPMVEADTNGVMDVYEWKQGRITLISTGQGDDPATIGDVSADGSNVFFETAARLVPGDSDDSNDMYDARVGGGFDESGPPGLAPCAGEGCQAASPPPVVAGLAGSAAFQGNGNARAPRAVRRGRKPRRHGRHHRKGHRRKKMNHRKASKRAARTSKGGRK